MAKFDFHVNLEATEGYLFCDKEMYHESDNDELRQDSTPYVVMNGPQGRLDVLESLRDMGGNLHILQAEWIPLHEDLWYDEDEESERRWYEEDCLLPKEEFMPRREAKKEAKNRPWHHATFYEMEFAEEEQARGACHYSWKLMSKRPKQTKRVKNSNSLKSLNKAWQERIKGFEIYDSILNEKYFDMDESQIFWGLGWR